MTAWPIMAVASFPITAARSYLQIRPPACGGQYAKVQLGFCQFRPTFRGYGFSLTESFRLPQFTVGYADK
jgi:hypothetical protein